MLIEQRFVGQRAGRHDARDLPLDRTFALGGIAHLLADRDRLTFLDEPRKVALGGVMGHARHRDRVTGRFAAGRQRDVEEFGGALGIRVEELVEIPHAIEEQHIRIVRLDGQVLAHHWRVDGGYFRAHGYGACQWGV